MKSFTRKIVVVCVLALLAGCTSVATGVLSSISQEFQWRMVAKEQQAAMKNGSVSQQMDSDMGTVKFVTPVTGEAFIDTARSLASQSGYSIAGMSANGGMRFVALARQSTSVALTLEENGLVIQVSASVYGAAPDSGSARKVVNEFKHHLAQRYASR